MNNQAAPLIQSLKALGATIALVLVAGLPSRAATVDSNGTGGGSWTSGSTWIGGVVPANTDLWAVLGTDSVTAGFGVTFNNVSAAPCSVQGTLTIDSGASFTLYHLNSGISSGHGTINVNGGTLISTDLLGSTGYTATINISNGGFVSQPTEDAIANVYTVNVNSGGTFSNAGGFLSGATVNLNTGGFIEAPSTAADMPTTNATFQWNGGTYVLNTNSYGIANSDLNVLMSAFQSNASNIIALSNQTSKQTLTLGTTTSSGSISPTQGILAFNVYSPTANDNDLLIESNTTGSNAAITLPAAVHLQIGNPGLNGTNSASYVGVSYKLFNTSGTYANINPTLDPTYWTINGVEYLVNWTNTLNSNGSLTVSSLNPPVGYSTGPYYTFGLDTNGFSIIPTGPTISGTTTVPSAHQNIYVSSSSGSDSNDGLSTSTPKLTTTAALNLVRKGSSDWVLLKRGDTFNAGGTVIFINPGNGNYFGSSTNPYYPQVLGSYGTGARPILHQYYFYDNHSQMQNYVIQDLNFQNIDAFPMFIAKSNNVLIENCQFNYQVVIQGSPAAGQYVSGLTIRRCEFLDCVRSNPYNGPYTTTAWGNDYTHILNNRLSGIYQNGTVSFLFEENIMDHCGWSAGYDPTGTQIGNPNQPPSEFSHNLYSGGQNFDMTVRNNITTEAASMGFKLASSGDIYGNVMVNNNIGMIIAEDPAGLYGCFLRMHDNLVEEASANPSPAAYEGALGWGIALAQAPPHPNGEVIRNLEIDSTASGSNTSLSTPSQLTWLSTNTLLSGSNVVYKFGTTPNQNPTGSAYYDSTRTVESYNASVGGASTLADFISHIRAQEKLTWNPAYTAQPILQYMQEGFNLTLPTATTAANYLASYGLTGANAALTADPNGDGVTNLMAYALGLNPTVQSANALPKVAIKNYADVPYAYITFHRSSLATDLTYIVQASSDLVDWTQVLATSAGGAATTGPGFVSETGPAPTFLVEVRDTQPVNTTTGSRRFLRLKVTSP